MIRSLIGWAYKNILKPILFTQDPEFVHNLMSKRAEHLGKYKFTRKIASFLFKFEDSALNQKIHGIDFKNPIGLSAGFDYDGHMAAILSDVGFGFNTVGTVTAKPYKGNDKPRLKRLPKSKSLLVNKGFKSEGVVKVMERLRHKELQNKIIGASIGSSNLPEIDTIEKAIADYVESFRNLENEEYIKYFEINISCPNTMLTEGFAKKENLIRLLEEIKKLGIRKPIFMKMANELTLDHADSLVEISLHHGISGFIFSNLVKDRTNPVFDKDEISAVSNLKGNFSGKPTYENSNKLINYVYKKYGKQTIIIGCGGVFSAEDAYEKIKNGASLVQLITGMIYEGPQLIGEINHGLVKLIEKDGFKNISEAVGKYHR